MFMDKYDIGLTHHEATGVKMAHVINKGRIPKLKEYLIVARKDGIKDLNVEKIPKDEWDKEYKLLVENVTKEEINELKIIIDNDDFTEDDILRADEICSKMTLSSINKLFEGKGKLTNSQKDEIKFEHAWQIVRDVATSGSARKRADEKREIVEGGFFVVVTPKRKKYIIKKDYNIEASQPRIKLLFADDYLTIHPGDFWQDIKTTGLDNEGGIDFKKGKKPEELIRRIIKMSSNEGDLVLDSFLGSGTTASVAHKMKRKWIGIEMGPHCTSHAMPRIQNVINGDDDQGITQKVSWQGGGGFKFYTLAPSLLKKDKFDNWIIEPTLNAELLASALAKQEAFTYFPDSELFWKQGYSTENDFIFTTTQFVTADFLDKIHDEMKEEETLLVCAKSFQEACKNRYTNISIKKIPQVLLGKCEFGKDDYSLNILEEISEDDDE